MSKSTLVTQNYVSQNANPKQWIFIDGVIGLNKTCLDVSHRWRRCKWDPFGTTSGRTYTGLYNDTDASKWVLLAPYATIRWHALVNLNVPRDRHKRKTKRSVTANRILFRLALYIYTLPRHVIMVQQCAGKVFFRLLTQATEC